MSHNTDTTEAQIEEIVEKKVEQKLEEQLSQAQGSGFSRREILTGVSILGVGAAGATLGTYGAVGQTAEQNGSGSIGTEDRPLSAIYTESIGSENTPVSSIHADTFSPESLHTEVSRTKEEPVINVKAFGAVGDDSTNDADAIQSAVDYAISQGGGTVFFPAGEYNLEGDSEAAIDIDVESEGEISNISLVGAGQYTSILRSRYNVAQGDDFSSSVIRFRGTSDTKLKRVSVKNLGIEIVENWPRRVVTMVNVHDGYVRNVYANNTITSDAGGVIFYMGAAESETPSSKNLEVSGCHTINNASANHSVQFAGVSGGRVVNNEFDNSASPANGNKIDGSEYIVFANNVCYGSGNSEVVAQSTHKSIFANNQIRDAGDDGLRFVGDTDPFRPEHNTAVGNHIEGVGGNGIYTDATVHHTHIGHNTVISASENGVLADGNLFAGSIVNNRIYEPGIYGIRHEGDKSTGGIIDSNYIYSPAGKAIEMRSPAQSSIGGNGARITDNTIVEVGDTNDIAIDILTDPSEDPAFIMISGNHITRGGANIRVSPETLNTLVANNFHYGGSVEYTGGDASVEIRDNYN